jgi:hypothetical protein
MNEITSHAGISISLSKLQLLEVAKEGTNYQIININESLFDEPLNFGQHKITLIAARLQSAFDRINIIKKIKSTNVSFSLPQEIFLIAELPFDNSLLYQDLIEEFKWEFSLLFPFISPEEIVLQYFETGKNTLNTKSTALVVAMEKKYLTLIKDFCTKNLLSLRYVDCSMFSANNLINSIIHPFSEGYVLNVYLSEKTFSVIANLNGSPAHSRVYPRIENKNTADNVAEALDSARFKSIKSGLLNDAFISGEDVSAEFISQIRLTTGQKFRQLNPFTSVRVIPELENNYLIKEKYGSFTSAAGIAFRLA